LQACPRPCQSIRRKAKRCSRSHARAAYIAEAPESSPQDIKLIDTAVAGSTLFLRSSHDVTAQSPNEGDPFNQNPHTLLGLSRQGRFLYFVVIDGCVAGRSTGTTKPQSAQRMKAIGADDAMATAGPN